MYCYGEMLPLSVMVAGKVESNAMDVENIDQGSSNQAKLNVLYKAGIVVIGT